ncbi:condensation domain-containing protein [Planotetraspora sp. A-T 1434]|uniref:condensation domain-containing protein n=1 Tax=Planotetraspora sp. A-T 1434 TaxID=2979219 RepID=UPI0021C0B53F|nr:condensation domain-containing protein [Planotetraspora sp. A-T 1434]MCT9932890.1 condensation domain-containing protein [Planotetraspora sp. A-T 1434]
MIAFSGARSGTAPLTWGQRAIWDTIERTAPDDHYFNFGRVLEVPRGARPASVAHVSRGIGLLLERHESLRTLVGPGPCQDLRDRGELAVRIVADADPAEILAELTANAFAYASEWPLRVALVTRGDEVTHVVLAFCHMASDGLGAEEVVRDLRLLLLRGRLQGGAPPQPFDLALWQESPAGRRQAWSAASYWEREHRRMPPTMFHVPSGGAELPPIWRGTLNSPAIDLAAQRLAVRHGTSTSTVLLTAVSALVAEVTGHETVAVLPIVSNRFRADTRTAVTTLSQEGLFVLDVEKSRFADLLATAHPAVLRAYRSAYHDPADRERIVAETSRDRGTPIHPYCCFNDMRFTEQAVDRDEALIRQALSESSLTWPLSQEQLNCRFCVHLSGAMQVSLTADTRWLSRQDIERFLFGLERLIVEAALR